MIYNSSYVIISVDITACDLLSVSAYSNSRNKASREHNTSSLEPDTVTGVESISGASTSYLLPSVSLTSTISQTRH